jgi:hypothetical protein
MEQNCTNKLTEPPQGGCNPIHSGGLGRTGNAAYPGYPPCERRYRYAVLLLYQQSPGSAPCPVGLFYCAIPWQCALLTLRPGFAFARATQ